MSDEPSDSIIIQLLKTYFSQEKYTAIALVFLSLIVNVIQAHGISRITAEIVQSIEDRNRKMTVQIYFYLCFAIVLFLLVSHIYKHLQINLLTKLRQWLRYNMLDLLLKSNKEQMDEINYARISSPINRTASVCFMLFNTIFSMILPDISFLFIISGFLLFTKPELGILFVLGNIIISIVIAFNWDTMFDKNMQSVEVEYDNEASLLEILHNFDKIIYRGQTEKESLIFEEKSKTAFSKALDFQSMAQTNGLYINIIASLIVALILWQLITQFYSKNISSTYFITALTMMILYRDKMASFVQVVPDCVEFVGRSNTALKHFKNISINNVERTFNKHNLPFEQIVFDNISFKYKSRPTDAVSGISVTLNTKDHAIIGITGLSGKGKSTIMKILLKVHPVKEGTVYIDGVNIEDISPDYIRKNITYISQDGKLFDRVVADNMIYGCANPEKCLDELQNILKYQKIRELFTNININQNKSGNMGDNLSGGQRQIVNIIGGLINPSKILVLDEPTNALDNALKWEVMRLIKDYSEKKNAILIVTHDRELIPIFSEVVQL
jgi:ABC-type bacteriocin/lantibiotic exporter with double-glycine peptidase domain